METPILQGKRPVLTKVDFVERYAAGEFGNAPPTWTSIEEFQRSGFSRLVHIRNKVKGGRTWYNVKSEDALELWKKLTRDLHPETLYISGMGPESQKIFQGEVQRGIWLYDLYYNTVAAPMKEVRPDSWISTSGFRASILLRRFLCPRSYEWLQHLLDTYEDHVVEFSTYSVEWGTIPGYNTVFWEVRRY